MAQPAEVRCQDLPGASFEAFWMDKLDRPVLLKEITPDNSWVFLVQLSDNLRSFSAVLLALFVAWSYVYLYKCLQEQVLDCFCQSFRDRLYAKSLADAVWFTKERREALVIFLVDSKDLAESTMMFRFADLDT